MKLTNSKDLASRDLIGPRCKEFQEGCFACEAWQAIDELVATTKLSLLSELIGEFKKYTFGPYDPLSVIEAKIEGLETDK